MKLIKIAAIGVLGWLAYKALTRRAPACDEYDLQQRRRDADSYDDWEAYQTAPRARSRQAHASSGVGR